MNPAIDVVLEENNNRNGNDSDDSSGNGSSNEERVGTISSARFNILSTMVGGGSLSLPLAFQKTGNLFFGPIMLLATAVVSEFCFKLLISAARTLHIPNPAVRGKDSYESITAAAFGQTGYVFSMGLVTSMCFFGTVGYAVLLRDMLQPVSDAWSGQTQTPGPGFANNLTMLFVVVAVTPACTLKTLTALERFGAASMCSVLLLGIIICYRSLQCNLPDFLDPSTSNNNTIHNHTFSLLDGSGASVFWNDFGNSTLPVDPVSPFQFWPDSWKDVLDAFPIFVSCFVCHYNIPLVHNELRVPSKTRVQWWLRSTVWTSTAFYMAMGIAGSAYRKCTATGQVQGNVLLDFDENDPLLLCGRMCLALTITLAFPMLTIPARDIIIRLIFTSQSSGNSVPSPFPSGEGQARQVERAHYSGRFTLSHPMDDDFASPTSAIEELREPLLLPSSNDTNDDNENNNNRGDNIDYDRFMDAAHERAKDEEQATASESQSSSSPLPGASIVQQEEPTQAVGASFRVRLAVAVVAFWSAAAVASCVKSIDVVWDLLGSSLSILMSYLVPCGSYLVITARQQQQEEQAEDESITGMSRRLRRKVSIFVSRLLLIVMIPLMFISTANAVYNTIQN